MSEATLGGFAAILAAERLVSSKLTESTSRELEVQQILDRMRFAVDQVMSEGALWAPQCAALAIRQAEGDLDRAAQLLRSYSTSLPEFADCVALCHEDMEVLRRVVPAFHNPPGEQVLGRTADYIPRILDTDRASRNGATLTTPANALGDTSADVGATSAVQGGDVLIGLREKGLLHDRSTPGAKDPEPYDVLREPVRPGIPRSGRLAMMVRAGTGALVQLWYQRSERKSTLGEVRFGHLPVQVHHPLTGNPVQIGEISTTDVITIDNLDGPLENRTEFDVGFGFSLGHNERKAIAMAHLDIAAEREIRRGATQLEYLLLAKADGAAAAGMIEHLKLPHYVSFQAQVDQKDAALAAHSARATDPPNGKEVPA